MTVTSAELEKLGGPTPREEIQWRVGKASADKKRGLALAYVDARFVQKRLDEVVGPENWQMRYPHVTEKLAVCEIGILIGTEWIWKSDGAGATDFEAIKGALSDAFKRAGVKWGIGRDLYDLESPWVPLGQSGRFIQQGVNPFDYIGKNAPPPPSSAPTSAGRVITGTADTREFSALVTSIVDKTAKNGKEYSQVTFSDNTTVNCNVAKFLSRLNEAREAGVPVRVTLKMTPDRKFWNIVDIKDDVSASETDEPESDETGGW